MSSLASQVMDLIASGSSFPIVQAPATPTAVKADPVAPVPSTTAAVAAAPLSGAALATAITNQWATPANIAQIIQIILGVNYGLTLFYGVNTSLIALLETVVTIYFLYVTIMTLL